MKYIGITDSGSELAGFLEWCSGATSLETIPATKFAEAKKVLEKRKTKAQATPEEIKDQM